MDLRTYERLFFNDRPPEVHFVYGLAYHFSRYCKCLTINAAKGTAELEYVSMDYLQHRCVRIA